MIFMPPYQCTRSGRKWGLSKNTKASQKEAFIKRIRTDHDGQSNFDLEPEDLKKTIRHARALRKAGRLDQRGFDLLAQKRRLLKTGGSRQNANRVGTGTILAKSTSRQPLAFTSLSMSRLELVLHAAKSSAAFMCAQQSTSGSYSALDDCEIKRVILRGYQWLEVEAGTNARKEFLKLGDLFRNDVQKPIFDVCGVLRGLVVLDWSHFPQWRTLVANFIANSIGQAFGTTHALHVLFGSTHELVAEKHNAISVFTCISDSHRPKSASPDITDYTEASLALIEALTDANALHEAVVFCKKILETLTPGSSCYLRALQQLWRIQSAQGHIDEAIETLLTAQTLADSAGDTWWTFLIAWDLAWTYGRHDTNIAFAEKWFREALTVAMSGKIKLSYQFQVLEEAMQMFGDYREKERRRRFLADHAELYNCFLSTTDDKERVMSWTT